MIQEVHLAGDESLGEAAPVARRWPYIGNPNS